jgi:hypothetical protein
VYPGEMRFMKAIQLTGPRNCIMLLQLGFQLPPNVSLAIADIGAVISNQLFRFLGFTFPARK